jgi:hypothetical protein
VSSKKIALAQHVTIKKYRNVLRQNATVAIAMKPVEILQSNRIIIIRVHVNMMTAVMMIPVAMSVARMNTMKILAQMIAAMTKMSTSTF